MTRQEQEFDHRDADATAAEAERQANRLLELAGGYVRDTLQLPSEVATLRTMVAELLLENGFLRHDLRRLTERVEALERARTRMTNTTSTRDTRSPAS